MCWRAGRSATAAERQRARTEQSFCVPKADIAAQGYDLSINRYKEVVHEAVEHLPPKEILAKLAKLEEEIQAGMKELEGMLRFSLRCLATPLKTLRAGRQNRWAKSSESEEAVHPDRLTSF
jgi:hypothetical protein